MALQPYRLEPKQDNDDKGSKIITNESKIMKNLIFMLVGLIAHLGVKVEPR